MDWITVQYSSGGSRSKPITDWGPIVHREKSMIVVHPVQALTKSLRFDLHTDTGFVLTNSTGKMKRSEIEIIASRLWESKYELQITLPKIKRIEENNGKLKSKGTLSKLIHPIGSKSFKIKTNKSKFQLEYKQSEWKLTKERGPKNGVRGQLISKDHSPPNFLKSNSTQLYLHSETTFNNISVLV